MILPNRAILVAHSLENCIRYIDTVEQTVSAHFGECKLSSCNRKKCSNVGDFTKVRLDRPHSFAEGKDGVYYLSVMSAVLKVNEKNKTVYPFISMSSYRHYSMAVLNESMFIFMSNGLFRVNLTSRESTRVSFGNLELDRNQRCDMVLLPSPDRSFAVFYSKLSSNSLRFGLTDTGYFELSKIGRYCFIEILST